MNIETLRDFCNSLPSVTEDVKWKNDLCFSIGNKIFCASSLTGPFSVSFKVKDDDFDELSSSNDIIPAPYAARYKWVMVNNPGRFTKKDWEQYVLQSYELVKAKLPQKVLKGL